MTDRLERLTLQAMATRLGLHIGARINQAREEAGLATQQALADLLPSPISNQYISKWEKGVKPTDKNLKLIAQALDKPVGWFYEGFEKNGNTPDLSARVGEPDQLAHVESMLQTIARALEVLLTAGADARSRLSAIQALQQAQQQTLAADRPAGGA